MVALGSVLVLEPAILILDEAMAQIDHSGRQRLKAILRKLRGKGITIMMVDHQKKANLDIADRIMYLANGTLYDKEI